MNYKDQYSSTYNVILTPITNLLVDENSEPKGLKDSQNVKHFTWEGQSQVRVIEYKSNFNDETIDINVSELDPAYHLVVSPEDNKTYYFIINASVRN